jgi:hypothetical protein
MLTTLFTTFIGIALATDQEYPTFSSNEVFNYFMVTANANESYRHLFDAYPEWRLSCIDPWTIDSYTEPGAIQHGFKHQEDEDAAIRYAQQGIENAPPAILRPSNKENFDWIHIDGQTRARAALLLGKLLLAFIPIQIK